MKLVITTFLTLDGVMQGPGGPAEDTSGDFRSGGWLIPYVDIDLAEFVSEEFAEADAFLLGRKTYELLHTYWGQVTDNVVGFKLNHAPKYVVSNSMESAPWANTTIICEHVVQTIRDLKAQPGNELQVHGSSQLAQMLIHHGLVDELRLWLFPVVLGSGKRLFGAGSIPAAFERKDIRLTVSGITVLTYRPVGAPKSGTRFEDDVEVTELVSS
jgi:dihydrofolate reductase